MLKALLVANHHPDASTYMDEEDHSCIEDHEAFRARAYLKAFVKFFGKFFLALDEFNQLEHAKDANSLCHLLELRRAQQQVHVRALAHIFLIILRTKLHTVALPRLHEQVERYDSE